jgi:ketopantoate reductase
MSGTPTLVRAFLSLVRETADLARAYGVRVEDYPGFPIRTYVDRDDDTTIAILGEHVGSLRASGAAENFPSMVQDALAGRPLEVEGVFGDLVDRAARLGHPIPLVAYVCDVLRGINAQSSHHAVC